MMDKVEAVKKLATVGRLSMSYAEDLYDSFFEKPVVPQYVADWYEENKRDFELNLFQCIGEVVESYKEGSSSEFEHWLMSEDTDVLQTLVNMHQFGYEVEEETKYTVRIKVTNQYLCNDDGILHFSPGFRMDFTKNDLKKLNLGWVFDCEGIEIEEVG
jgi:hypothetical protein